LKKLPLLETLLLLTNLEEADEMIIRLTKARMDASTLFLEAVDISCLMIVGKCKTLETEEHHHRNADERHTKSSSDNPTFLVSTTTDCIQVQSSLRIVKKQQAPDLQHHSVGFPKSIFRFKSCIGYS
jgi:hypothetical protein